MAPALDPAIAKALSIDPTSSTVKAHGSSGFASTFKITATIDGKESYYFVKTAKGKDAEVMFAGEHASLNALSSTIPTLCPKSHAHGALTSSQGCFFLVTSFIDLSPSSIPKSQPSISLAHKLAKLHSIPVPTPDGYDRPQFGFPVPTACGDSIQDNSFQESWADFFARRRLGAALRLVEGNHGPDKALAGLVDRVVEDVVPRLLGAGHLRQGRKSGEGGGGEIVPVLVHGDLWSGNRGRGVLGGDGQVEEVVFDPSCCWAHGEYEWGIMKMFGGFGEEFEKEYREVKGRDEPVEEWEDRVELYELYHHLNHYAIFGRGYRGGAVRIMERLIEKYGNAA